MAARISQLNRSAQRVLVVANTTAGAGPREDAVRALVDRLDDYGIAAEVITDLSKFDTLVERYHSAGDLRAVVAAGGDGTIAEVVNRTAPDVPITVYPLGTANLLANYFHLRRDPRLLAHTLANGLAVRLDAGRANGRVFLLMAGCGFDADVVARLHRARRGRHISYWTWAKPILETIGSYGYPDLHVHCELPLDAAVDSVDYRARWAFAVNLPCYAGGLLVAPGASGTDGLLNVSTFDKGSFWHGLRYVGLVALGWHQVLRDFRTQCATRVRIESSESVPYQLDGDPGGMLPLEIEAVAERFTMVAPRHRINELFPAAGSHLTVGAAQ